MLPNLRLLLPLPFLVIGLVGCSPPAPVNLIVFLDSSASFEGQRADAIELILKLNEQLNPGIDRLRVFRVAGEVDWLYSSEKPGSKKLREELEAYVRVKPSDRGTAYGAALQRGLSEVQDVAGQGRRTALVFLGDGADEHTSKDANIDWHTIPPSYSKLPESAKVFFLFLEPHEGDRFREAFKPVLGSRFEPFTPLSSTNGTAKSKIVEFLRNY